MVECRMEILLGAERIFFLELDNECDIFSSNLIQTKCVRVLDSIVLYKEELSLELVILVQVKARDLFLR